MSAHLRNPAKVHLSGSVRRPCELIPNNSPQPLDPDTCALIVDEAHRYEKFDRVLQSMRIRPSRIFDDLSRMIVIHHCEGKPRCPSYYDTKFLRVASSNTVRREFLRMADLGLIKLHPKPNDRRGNLVSPTQKLLDLHLLRIRYLCGREDKS
jgi:hypothetical protein